MKTVHHGSSFSIPLHPEHHEPISKLKDNQEHKFKDETGRHWTAKRMGDDVHFHSANDGPKTKVAHKHIAEGVIQPSGTDKIETSGKSCVRYRKSKLKGKKSEIIINFLQQKQPRLVIQDSVIMVNIKQNTMQMQLMTRCTLMLSL